MEKIVSSFLSSGSLPLQTRLVNVHSAPSFPIANFRMQSLPRKTHVSRCSVSGPRSSVRRLRVLLTSKRDDGWIAAPSSAEVSDRKLLCFPVLIHAGIFLVRLKANNANVTLDLFFNNELIDPNEDRKLLISVGIKDKNVTIPGKATSSVQQVLLYSVSTFVFCSY